MENLLRHVDLYCERTGPEYWAEPINALSNLAFVAAGLWFLVKFRSQRRDGWTETLAWMVTAVGIGSWLFHTHANRLTIFADVIPIAIFTLTYILYAIRRYLGLAWPAGIAVFVGYLVVIGAVTMAIPESWRDATNGSTGYLPAWAALVVFGATAAIVKGNRAGLFVLAAAGLMLLSLVFRAIDPLICEAFPIGTHFLWHIFNGVMLAVLLAGADRYGSPSRA